eukprot:SAG22_NODE_5283_length_1046_cov_1.506864_2_plen_85_part_00
MLTLLLKIETKHQLADQPIYLLRRAAGLFPIPAGLKELLLECRTWGVFCELAWDAIAALYAARDEVRNKAVHCLSAVLPLSYCL